MSNKMLIDASHPEETRVAVVRGNRIEEFDFESQEKRQLRGNIYLAKVTRVEPSLQAAFVDYGGNRHGFLAFSEIHPDYYQIPMADRQALLEAEAEDARASREEEEREDEESLSSAENEDKPKRSRRRRSRRGRNKDADEATTEEAVETEASAESTETTETTSEAVEEAPEEEAPKPKRKYTRRKKAAETEETAATEESETEAVKADAPADEKADEAEKPKRRTTRRKKAATADKDDASEGATSSDAEAETVEQTAEAETKPKRRTTRRKSTKADPEENSENTDNSDDDGGQTMAAVVEIDSISEPLPEIGDDDDEADADAESKDSGAEASEEPAAEAKPKRRTTRRTSRKKKVEEAEETADNEAENEEQVLKSEDEPQNEAAEETAEEEASEEKPKKRPARKRTTRKKKAEVEASDADEEETPKDAEAVAEASEEPEEPTADEDIESVGQEDALEEVETPRRMRRYYKIQEVIKRRQILLVQVVKEERGNKGAALTTYLSLAGRYSVLMPNTARGGGISRKITNASDRKRLKSIANELDVPQGMGVILRTAGAARTKDEITRDFEYLMRLWEQVRSLTLSSSAPCLVYEEGSLIKRSIRDLYNKDTGEVLVSGEDGFKEAKDFMTMLMPSHAKKVKQYRESQSIFSRYSVETQLDKLVTPQVTLKSGGYLIINQTEALVAVDVNSGRSTREHSIEDTALQTNLEAAEEVARQLRLRDLAGLIVIDFIDMEEKRNNRAVEKKLQECLKNDRARIQVGRISHFGLMEMSRQRMRASVLESTMDVCPHCAGTGYIRSDSAIALHVFRAIEEHVGRHNKFNAVVKTTPSIAMFMLNHKRAALLDLENRYGLKVLIESDHMVQGQDFAISKGDLATGEPEMLAVGLQNNGSFDSADAGDEGDNKRRNRKRNRKRNEEAEAEEMNEAVANSSENGDAEDDDRPRKKRRRGKRGGRKRNSNGEEATQLESGEAAIESQDDQEIDASQDTDAGDEAAETEKPKRRSTRRKKAPVTEEAAENTEEASATDTSVEEARPETGEEEAAPKRRNTRRKKAPVKDDVEVAAEEVVADKISETPDAATEETPKRTRRTTRRVSKKTEASDNESTPAKAEGDTDDASDSEGSEKPKKTSWWNRGGGFF